MEIPIKMDIILNKNLLGLNIKYLRKQKKLTQGALCDIIGSKTTTLSNWEVGTAAPDLETVIVLSNYFGITIDDLVLKPSGGWAKTSVANLECSKCAEKERTINALGIAISSHSDNIVLLKDKIETLKLKITTLENELKGENFHSKQTG